MHDESSTPPAVTGQGDEIDRGTATATSGGGLGKSTGFWSEAPARKNMRENGIDDTIDGKVEREPAERPATIVVDDELKRPPEDRSPLT